jgi:hypothetical protein
MANTAVPAALKLMVDVAKGKVEEDGRCRLVVGGRVILDTEKNRAKNVGLVDAIVGGHGVFHSPGRLGWAYQSWLA